MWRAEEDGGKLFWFKMNAMIQTCWLNGKLGFSSPHVCGVGQRDADGDREINSVVLFPSLGIQCM